MMNTLISMADHVLLSLSNHRRYTAIFGTILWVSQVLFGAFSPSVLIAVVVLLISDWVLGTIRAWKEARASERAAFQGLVKSLVYLSLLFLTTLLVRASLGPVWKSFSTALVSFVGASILLTELISVLKHIRFFTERANVYIPVLDVFLVRLEKEAKKYDVGDRG